MDDERAAGNWEYLGTVAQNGVEFMALRPVNGDGGACFFFLEAGTYRRVGDAAMEQALSRRFRQAALEEARDRLREAR